MLLSTFSVSIYLWCLSPLVHHGRVRACVSGSGCFCAVRLLLLLQFSFPFSLDIMRLPNVLVNLRVSCRYLNSGAIALGLLSKVFMQLAPLRSFVLSSLLYSLYFRQWNKKWYTESSAPLHAGHVGESALAILCICFCNAMCPVRSCISRLACLWASPVLSLEYAGEGIVGSILSANVARGDFANMALASFLSSLWCRCISAAFSSGELL